MKNALCIETETIIDEPLDPNLNINFQLVKPALQ